MQLRLIHAWLEFRQQRDHSKFVIAILDYGSGNLRSAARAFETSGHEVILTSDSKIALEADGLVVPGVGAFKACMKGITDVGGDSIIRLRKEKDRPTLGICIGMQILFKDSDEDGVSPGIGLWPTSVRKLAAPILPHMGWNTVNSDPHSQLFTGVEDESFYFVHSYAAQNVPDAINSFSTHGTPFLAAVENGTLSATQFHPEKSGRAGLALIKNWSSTL